MGVIAPSSPPLAPSLIDGSYIDRNYVGNFSYVHPGVLFDHLSLRALFGTDNQKNAVHGSDSTNSAVREIHFFFPDGK